MKTIKYQAKLFPRALLAFKLRVQKIMDQLDFYTSTEKIDFRTAKTCWSKNWNYTKCFCKSKVLYPDL